ncbi:MAG: hypothetical protein ABIK15_03825 [Pseudomonadota bacterium]
MPKRFISILASLLILPAIISLAFADTEQSGNKVPEVKELYELGIEYFQPVQRDRQIRTATANILKRSGYYDDLLITVYAGLTVNYAWGHILQEDRLNREIEYSNSAFGIGPLFHARWSPISVDGLALSMDAAGGILFHNKAFPAGGDYYNFIWRIGPSISYPLKDKQTLILGFRMMHVSNGQGVTRDNPAYDAAGVSLHVSRYF